MFYVFGGFGICRHRSSDVGKVVHLPFYGGAEGNILQLVHKADGTVESSVIRKEDTKGLLNGSFEKNLHDIQEAAAQLVTIQESAKKRGSFSTEDNEYYANNLNQLGVAAQNLAKLQQQGGIQDFRDLFAPTKSQDDFIHKLDLTKLPAIDTQLDAVDTIGYDAADSVQVNAPNKDAAVAEAKPVGLAIAGEGGVAQSKPVATAIAGDQGLAIARPVATAIAGVSPDYVSSLGVQKYRKPVLQNKDLYFSSDFDSLRSGNNEKPAPTKSPVDDEKTTEKKTTDIKTDDKKLNVISVAPVVVATDVLAPIVEMEKLPEENSSGATKFTKQITPSGGGDSDVRSVLNRINLANRIPNYGPNAPNIQNSVGTAGLFNFRNIPLVPNQMYANNYNPANPNNNQYPELIYFV